MIAYFLLTTFSVPQDISTTGTQLLWLMPLAIAGIVVYKAIKLPQISPALFLREVFTLFIFLLGLLLLITIVIFAITYLMT